MSFWIARDTDTSKQRSNAEYRNREQSGGMQVHLLLQLGFVQKLRSESRLDFRPRIKPKLLTSFATVFRVLGQSLV